MRRALAAGHLVLAFLLLAAPVGRAEDAVPDLRAIPGGRELIQHFAGNDSIVVARAGTITAYAPRGWADEGAKSVEIARGALPPIAFALGVAPHALDPIWIIVSPGGGGLAREAPEWSAAIAEPQRHLIVLSGPALRSMRARLGPTVAHELVHLALHARIGENAWVPRWFDEGVAMYLAQSLGWRDRFLAFGRGPVSLDDLAETFPRDADFARFAYVESEAAVRHLFDRGAVAPLLGRVAAGDDFRAAFLRVNGESVAEFSRSVHDEVAGRWRWVAWLGGGLSLGGFMALLAVVAALRTRWRDRRRMREWAAAESALESAPPDRDEPSGV